MGTSAMTVSNPPSIVPWRVRLPRPPSLPTQIFPLCHPLPWMATPLPLTCLPVANKGENLARDTIIYCTCPRQPILLFPICSPYLRSTCLLPRTLSTKLEWPLIQRLHYCGWQILHRSALNSRQPDA
jgi:hypothetical protein